MIKVVMYHYVREFNDEIPRLNFLHVDDFKRQLDFFERDLGILSYEDWQRYLSGEEVSGYLLTFDDGLADHYKYVYPELLKRNKFGVFYISSMPLLDKEPCAVHLCHFLLAKYSAFDIYNSIIEFSHIHEIETDVIDQVYTKQENSYYENQCKTIINYAYSGVSKTLLCKFLMSKYQINKSKFIEDIYMTECQAIELSSNGMLMGSHFHSHDLLGKLTEIEQDSEVIRSNSFLSALLNKSTMSFCYPYGGVCAFNDFTLKLLQKVNADFSFIVKSEPLAKMYDESLKLQLPRFDCNEFEYGSRYEY